MSTQTTAQKVLIARALELAYLPPPEGSAADQGWGCVARLQLWYNQY